MDAKNVSYGKPQFGGAIHSAPLGTALPTDAITNLDTSFKNLGYVSEDGLINSNTRETEVIKAWGGDTVLVTQTSKDDTFQYTLIETLNIDVLKEVYGEDNVDGDLDTGITIKSNAIPLEGHSIVIDMILKGDVLKRIVIPNGTVSEIGDIQYVDNDATGYETTLTCAADEEGNTHYEYVQKASTPTEGI